MQNDSHDKEYVGPHEVRYRSHITGTDALFERCKSKDEALRTASALKERCVKFDNKLTAGSVFIQPC